MSISGSHSAALYRYYRDCSFTLRFFLTLKFSVAKHTTAYGIRTHRCISTPQLRGSRSSSRPTLSVCHSSCCSLTYGLKLLRSLRSGPNRRNSHGIVLKARAMNAYVLVAHPIPRLSSTDGRLDWIQCHLSEAFVLTLDSEERKCAA